MVVAITLNPEIKNISRSLGRAKSVVIISAENLVRIAPIGFESKNITGARSNFHTI